MTTDIAIIGIAVEVPGADDTAALWDVVREGRSLSRPFPPRRRRDVEQFARFIRETGVSGWSEAAGLAFHPGSYLDRIDAFDHEFFGMTPRQAEVTDPHQRLVLRTTYRALEDAGYLGERLRAHLTGIFVGFAANPGGAYFDYFSRIDPSLGQVGLTGNLPTMLANRLSYLFDLQGPSMVIDSACSATLVALHQARTSLLMGDCEMAVVAGTRIVLFPIDHPYTRIGIESSDGMTRTFDESADGTGHGEGSGVVVLKPLDRALADGDQVYAVIKGSAVNHDGRSEALTGPDADAQVRLLTHAWRTAGVDPRSIGYLEVHGTATRVGDPIEFDALSRALGSTTDDRGFCAVGTAKANIGHLFEGSGVIGLIKAALTLQRAEIPPLANFVELNSLLDVENSPLRVPTEPQPWPAGAHPRRAGVTAFGLGGTNAHVVLEEYVAATAEPSPPGPYLFTLSARTERSLRRSLRALIAHLERGGVAGSVADVCYTSNVSRSGHPVRTSTVVDDLAQLRRALGAVLDPPAPAPATPPADERSCMLKDLGAAWVAGDDVDLLSQFEGRGPGRRPRTVQLTPYAFDDARAWVDFPADWRSLLPSDAVREPQPAAFSVRFETVSPAGPVTGQPSVVALVDPDTSAPAVLAAALPEARQLSLVAQRSVDGQASGFTLDDDGLAAVADLVMSDSCSHLVYALGFEEEAANDVTEFDRRVEKNLLGLFLLAKALIQAGARLSLVVLTRSAIAVGETGAPDDDTGLVTENAAAAGLVKAMVREYPPLTARLLDVDTQVPAAVLRTEVLAPESGVLVLRGGRKYAEVVAEIPDFTNDGEAGPAAAGSHLRAGGAYLLTGGTGGIALAVAQHFARQQPDIDLYLLSRSGLPPREQWEALLDTSDDGVLVERIGSVLEIEQIGARVHLVRGDAADETDLRRALHRIRMRHGRLAGLVHSAGVPGENLIAFRQVDDVRTVIAPKMRAAFLLDHLLRPDRPDFVVHMSSVAATFPVLGQADYAAANFYLDNLATATANRGGRVLAVDWVAWRDTGMAVATGANEDAVFKALPTPLALDLLDRGLKSDRSRYLAGQLNYDSELAHLATTYEARISDDLARKIDEAMASMAERLQQAAAAARRAVMATTVDLAGRPSGEYSDLELLIARCVAFTLGVSRVVVDFGFREHGVDSIAVLSMTANLSACLGYDVDPVDLFTSPNVQALAEVLELTYGDVPVEAEPQPAG